MTSLSQGATGLLAVCNIVVTVSREIVRCYFPPFLLLCVRYFSACVLNNSTFDSFLLYRTVGTLEVHVLVLGFPQNL